MIAFYIFVAISVAIIFACILPSRKGNEQSISDTFESLREAVGAKNVANSHCQAMDNAQRAFAQLDGDEVRRHRRDMPFDLMPSNLVGIKWD